MTDLVEFLRARLDEDAAVAEAAIADDGGQDGGFESADFLTDGRTLPRFGDAAAAMIRTFAVPARVLREVRAKRTLLEWAETGAREAAHESAHSSMRVIAGAFRDSLRALAVVYADHPDYREEWRP